MRHQQIHRFGRGGDKRKIADRIKVEFHHRWIGGVTRCVQHDGVAIGRSATRKHFAGNRRIGAAAIFNHKLLAHLLGEFLSNRTRHQIIGAAGRKAHHKTHCLGGIVLRLGNIAYQQQE